jgi:hypothetical protein
MLEKDAHIVRLQCRELAAEPHDVELIDARAGKTAKRSRSGPSALRRGSRERIPVSFQIVSS